MGWSVVTPPTEWPVTLVEAKAQCRVRHDDEDAIIQAYIQAATQHLENELSRSIAVQTLKLTLDEFSDAIELVRGPVISVDAVQYYDENGLTQTASTDLYTVDLVSRSAWVVLNSDETWPDTLSAVNTVSITYTAGYETAPDDLRAAILLLVGHWYANRETVNVGNITSELPLATSALIQPYRWVLV